MAVVKKVSSACLEALSVVNIAHLSEREVEASWLRPEERWWGLGGRTAEQRAGPALPASLCGPATACEMTGRVTQGA